MKLVAGGSNPAKVRLIDKMEARHWLKSPRTLKHPGER